MPDRIIPRIYSAIRRGSMTRRASPFRQIAGIGIAAPGPLDYKTGIIHDPPNLARLGRVPLRDLFTEHYHIHYLCRKLNANFIRFGPGTCLVPGAAAPISST